MKIIYIVIIGILFILSSRCGDVPVNVDEDTYVPKIVVDGYLFPGQKVKDIRITRNYALNTEIMLDQVVFSDVAVTVTDFCTQATLVVASVSSDDHTTIRSPGQA